MASHGGPLHDFTSRTLDSGNGEAANPHTITVPIANHDNNQHSSNENIRLQNFWSGIETMATVMQIE